MLKSNKEKRFTVVGKKLNEILYGKWKQHGELG